MLRQINLSLAVLSRRTSTKLLLQCSECEYNKMDVTNELMEIKKKEFLEKKRQQQLRLECEELRHLEKQLRTAYISKELADQIALSKQHIREMEQIKQRERAEFEEQRLQAMEEMRLKELDVRKKQEALRDTLNLQLEEIRRKRLIDYQGLVVEKDIQDKMQRIIEKEEKEVQLANEQIKMKTRNELQAYEEMQQAHKSHEKAKDQEETERILSYQKVQDEKKNKLQAEQVKLCKQKQERSAELGEQMYKLEEEKRRREHVLQELLQFELRAKEDEKFRARMTQEELKREQTKRELQHYRNEVLARNEALIKQRKEEAIQCRLAAQEEAALKLTEKQEQALQQKRKEHGALLLNMIEENKRKRADALADHVQFYQQQAEADRQRETLIEAERIKMLRSLPPDVICHLPNGVLKDADRQHLSMAPKKH